MANSEQAESDLKSNEYDVDYSEEKSDLRVTSEPKGDEIAQEKSFDELYTELNDKNRTIETLNRRLTNQQLQLTYYLHKNLTTDNVLEFSSKCYPQFAEDNTQLSLAMYKFIRDTGGKTRLVRLHEKLTEYGHRVQIALIRHEKLVRRFEYDDTETAVQLEIEDSERETSESKELIQINNPEFVVGDECFNYRKKSYRVNQLEISSQLLNAMSLIKKELQKFRICSEKIIKLEEERNILVDRVFSLPPEEREGPIQLTMIEENHQKAVSDDTHEISDDIPSATSVSTNTNLTDLQEYEKHEQKDIGGALRDMESEALQLLLMSEKQKGEFVEALEQARDENQQLRDRLHDLEEAASDERVTQLQEKCFNIEKEVNEMRHTMEVEQQEKDNIIKKMASELHIRQLNEVNYQQEIKALEETIFLLTEERDDLQRRMGGDQRFVSDFCNQKTSTDEMLQREDLPSQVPSAEVDELTDLVVLQEEQIKDLLTIMSGLGIDTRSHCDMKSNETVNECEEKSEYSEEDTRRDDEEDTRRDDEEDTRRYDEEDTQRDDDDDVMKMGNFESTDSGVYSPNTKKIDAQAEKEVEKVIEELLDGNANVFFDSSSDLSNQIGDEDIHIGVDIPSVTISETPTEMKTTFSDSENKFKRSRRKRYFVQEKGQQAKQHPMKFTNNARVDRNAGVATTSLRIETRDKDGKSESMHAVLECSSPVDGLLEMDNASKLHLRLQCTSPQRDYSLVTINENYEERVPFCTEKHVSGDHKHKRTSCTNLQLNREAKLYLSKQLNKLKNQLQTDKNSTNSVTRKDIVNNLNEIYSNLFDENVTSQSVS